MCLRRCTKLSDACEECIEELCESHALHQEHKAISAVVAASPDEWRARLDELAPLVTSIPSTQGLSSAEE